MFTLYVHMYHLILIILSQCLHYVTSIEYTLLLFCIKLCCKISCSEKKAYACITHSNRPTLESSQNGHYITCSWWHSSHMKVTFTRLIVTRNRIYEWA